MIFCHKLINKYYYLSVNYINLYLYTSICIYHHHHQFGYSTNFYSFLLVNVNLSIDSICLKMILLSFEWKLFQRRIASPCISLHFSQNCVIFGHISVSSTLSSFIASYIPIRFTLILVYPFVSYDHCRKFSSTNIKFKGLSSNNLYHNAQLSRFLYM